ncbi:hypothetical protein ASPCAL06881 [Aspergillus calidoustus]|uniref:Uncharacterized protein n=1 Tax=Aspergillus calidoustus TaxID=454130 RepID=A0A0U5G264_ASPCI|nr:hypothetical protein ASPCAL06881 [Aspergillus calidoustus]
MKHFTGPFGLPGIANASRLNAGGDGTLRLVNIPSFEVGDLEYVDELWLIRLDELETFLVRKLAAAGSVTLDIGSHLDTFEIPALDGVEYLELTGNFTEWVVLFIPGPYVLAATNKRYCQRELWDTA